MPATCSAPAGAATLVEISPGAPPSWKASGIEVIETSQQEQQRAVRPAYSPVDVLLDIEDARRRAHDLPGAGLRDRRRLCSNH